MNEFRSKTLTLEDSIDSVYEMFYKQGWTDGLPIVPPTKERVAAMISTVGKPASEGIAVLPPKMGEATIEKLAINSVMAGCLPSYFPVIVAAVEALADPTFDLASMNTTTSATSPMLILNGPVRQLLDVNCGWGLLGPGWRANATIGRAISLIMLNIAGRVPGEVSKAVIGFPGRYGMCIGEREEGSPWEPYHVEKGFHRDESTVTVVSPCGAHPLEAPLENNAEELLTTLAGALHLPLLINVCPWWGLGEVVLIIGPDHARILAEGGFSKQDVKQYFYEHTQDIPLSFFSESLIGDMVSADNGERLAGVSRRKMVESGLIREGQRQVTDKGVALAARPDQFLIIVGGGDGRIHSAFLPTFGDSFAVTRSIALKAE
ncbi:hypothetical protein ACFLUK_01860 [Chloroflexota bacterium]